MAKKPTNLLSQINVGGLIRGAVAAAFAKKPGERTGLTRIVGSDSPGSLFSTVERENLSRNVRPQTKASGRRGAQQPYANLGVDQYLNTVSEELASNGLDNRRIVTMAPEVGQAIKLVVPSIISPNDMRHGTVGITSTLIDETSDEGLRAAYSEAASIVQKHLEEAVNLSDSLPGWLTKALYLDGSHSLMIIPTSALNKLFNDPEAMRLSTESLVSKISSEEWAKTESSFVAGTESFASIFSAPTGADSKAFNDQYRSLYEDLPKYISEAAAAEGLVSDGAKEKKAKSTYDDQAASGLLGNIILEVLSEESLEVTDRVEAPAISKKKTKKAEANLKKSLAERYHPQSIIPIPGEDTLTDGEQLDGDHPLTMTIPAEAVIPIYVPGAPHEHIGYFVILDENGNPLETSTELAKESTRSPIEKKSSPFEKMFRSYGLDELRDSLASGRQSSNQVMAKTYQKIVEYHLENRLEKLGFSKISVSSMNAIYNHMFSRYLEGRKTRVLFVPKEFMIYMCYEYNTNGTGRSRLEDCKFILALRITLLIANMMSAINSSIDRRKVTIGMPQGDNSPQMDPLAVIRMVTKEFVDKQTFGFSSDPSQVMQGIASRSISVKATGIPGLDNFDVESEQADSNRGIGENPLSEDVKNLLVLSMDVPPSALNSLSENEFSRSIATTSLFFSRKISQLQKTTVGFLTDLAQAYAINDGIIIRQIQEILDRVEARTESGSGDQTTADSGSIDEDALRSKEAKGLAKAYAFASTLRAVLPKPNVAPDKSQFENLDALINSINNAVDNIYPDDIATGDEEAEASVRALRAHVKTLLMRKQVVSLGMGPDMEFPTIAETNIETIMDIRQALRNISSGIEQNKEALSPKDSKDAESEDSF